jgi:hypothetical protein
MVGEKGRKATTITSTIEGWIGTGSFLPTRSFSATPELLQLLNS